jgi:hypothetical protein
MELEDMDLIQEEKMEDDAYEQTALDYDSAKILLNQTALSEHDIKSLLGQIGTKVTVENLSALNFFNMKPKKWYLIFCEGIDGQKPAHWISCVSHGDLIYVFDSFGRHIQDIYLEHKINPVNEEVFSEPMDFITLTDNYQGPVSQACGYYQCVFGAIFRQQNPEQFKEITSSLFTSVDDDETNPTNLGVITFHNDKVAIKVFKEVFTITDNISSANFKRKLIQVSFCLLIINKKCR